MRGFKKGSNGKRKCFDPPNLWRKYDWDAVNSSRQKCKQMNEEKTKKASSASRPSDSISIFTSFSIVASNTNRLMRTGRERRIMCVIDKKYRVVAAAAAAAALQVVTPVCTCKRSGRHLFFNNSSLSLRRQCKLFFRLSCTFLSLSFKSPSLSHSLSISIHSPHA